MRFPSLRSATKPVFATMLLIFCGARALGAAGDAEKPGVVASPDGKLTVLFSLTAEGAPRYEIQREGRRVLRESKLGVVRDDADFSSGLTLASASKTKAVDDRYEILTAKRRENTYRANRRSFALRTAKAQAMEVIFQVSNDGVAFRYFFPADGKNADGKSAAEPKAGAGALRRIEREATTFHFQPETRAWLQPMSAAKTGWKETNPSYEEYYQKEIPVGTVSPTGAGWVYPALFRAGDTWLLVSEGSLGRNYCATRLGSESPDGEYAVGFPDARENFQGGAVNPASTLPWTTPWRFIVVGDLATVTESMLGVDLAEKPTRKTAGSAKTVQPGKAAWSWPLMGDGKTTYDVQKRFIDYAAEMGWRYCLIDALWDTQIGYEKMKELIDHARGKNVGVLLWYNSNGDWNGAPQTPRHLLLTRESRLKEFTRLKAMGVAGLKIDFFGGDGQSQIGYYHDLLEDAAPFGFLMNFHGCTLPRGWQRTYPHLMTAEAIRGLEFITFEQTNADQAPSHAAMLPFTRNVFDPMDFTPVVLDRINKIERRTTSGFELALSVLFTSGIQHYAEIPEGMAKAPDYVREFMKRVPSVWDDVEFLAGEPGKLAVLARRGEGRWYVAGINGEAVEKTVSVDLGRLVSGAKSKGDKAGAAKTGAAIFAVLITDGKAGNLSFRRDELLVNADGKLAVTLKANGGFVLTIE